ncbi:cyclic pyranopterin phosphate synthase [Sulfobacillus thermosulfidooxidans DSM 9293]|uniref:GTP 3',8-cyclase n=1 Tax=Sulfobacillus thermosulfidooxidans (strain DSM 9293 / VKM B-1269 / AT-1) TaxID=929705 RepID=A0A1W1W7N8_SULTA|nr:GTP 3',8-cyclase MoaA [Sulfobacillus thermosulfidooxidans]SMC02275.1 cyclic pyranopterin phosphate synthase [Sulfobacillus thermosulfidooxidans DSM 9293]
MPTVTDQHKRPLRDLRLSVTDRCNFRCVYCMPKEVFGAKFHFLPKHDLLTFDELTRTVRIFSQLGVKKVRITGGEPLLRQDLDVLIRQLSEVPGIEDIAMTTNGYFLDRRRAMLLRQAGLKRVTISLDALTDEVFKAVNDVGVPVGKILSAIDAAIFAGLGPVKVNMVVKRDVNDQQIIPMARHFRHSGVVLRFIEYMDVGNTNGWRLDDVVPASEILAILQQEWPLEPLAPNHPGEVARRFRYQDGGGEIGIIASVTQPFCHHCSRIRLSPEGRLYTCLFGSEGFDLRHLLREERWDDAQIENALQLLWQRRTDQYSLLRSQATSSAPKVEMSHIGG